MNKKGMTLIELLVAIGILALVSLILMPSITGIRKTSLNRNFEQKISQIQMGALDYAKDKINSIPGNLKCIKSSECCNTDLDKCNKYCEEDYDNKSINDSYTCIDDCYLVTVSFLIERGYVVGDNNSKDTLLNPLSNNSFNNEYVCIRYDSEDAMNRIIEAYVIGKEALKE